MASPREARRVDVESSRADNAHQLWTFIRELVSAAAAPARQPQTTQGRARAKKTCRESVSRLPPPPARAEPGRRVFGSSMSTIGDWQISISMAYHEQPRKRVSTNVLRGVAGKDPFLSCGMTLRRLTLMPQMQCV
ncbi:hypothetical protein ACJQWK_08759 [Exserohilum turcicum]